MERCYRCRFACYYGCNRFLPTSLNHWPDVVSRLAGIDRWLRVGSVHYSTTSQSLYQGFQPSTCGYERTLSIPQPPARRSIKAFSYRLVVKGGFCPLLNHRPDVVSRPASIDRWLRVGSVHYSTTSQTLYQGLRASTSGCTERTASNAQHPPTPSSLNCPI